MLFWWQESSSLCLLPAQLPQTVRHLFKDKDLQGQKSSKYFRRWYKFTSITAVGEFHRSATLVHVSVTLVHVFNNLKSSLTIVNMYLLNRVEEGFCNLTWSCIGLKLSLHTSRKRHSCPALLKMFLYVTAFILLTLLRSVLWLHPWTTTMHPNLTSPITWCRACSFLSRFLRWVPTLVAFPLRSSLSITSRRARPIAQDTGFPPNCRKEVQNVYPEGSTHSFTPTVSQQFIVLV